MRTLALSISFLILGSYVVWGNTNGLKTFTAEGQRRLSIAQTPRPLPPLPLIDFDGTSVTLSRLGDKVTLVDFIYTRCLTVCRQQSLLFEELSQEIVQRKLSDQVQLVSISFDPVFDDIDALKEFAEQFNAQSPLWRFVRVKSSHDLKALLAVFGVTVIPDKFGGFEHNAGVHVVTSDGRFSALYDIDAQDIVTKALTLNRHLIQEAPL